MVKILLAEDEQRMRRILVDFLKRESFQVIEAEDGEQALNLFTEHKEDLQLILLDVMMPHKDGWEVCKTIREQSAIPIIMITAKGEEYDELFGFNIGVDEYITKPFKPLILMARIKALLKRSSQPQEAPQVAKDLFTAANFEFDMMGRKVFIEQKQVDLTHKEFDLLAYFVENRGIALTREQILSTVWGYEYYGEDRTVDTHINRLRIKLGPCASYVQTVRGIGYRFEVE